MNTAEERSDNGDRAIAFVRNLHDRYATYHSHKESMAFTGLTLFTGAAGAALVAEKWPPTAWGTYGWAWAFLAVTALWVGVLAYLRFQLRRRRFAALRVAGCEHVLAGWVASPPSAAQVVPKGREHIEVSCFVRWADFFWPQKTALLAIKPESKDNPAMYPAALVDAWISQEKQGTDALKHERLIVFAGWVLYVALALYSVRTLAV
ncbi:MAG: hypothetical protein K0Q89_1281 [Thermomicrobiales bacterium]|nr:hypothetical protein [Thermomicrobiales bacterium]